MKNNIKRLTLSFLLMLSVT